MKEEETKNLITPSNEEMEQAVVLAVITQSSAMNEIAGRLRPDMFVNSNYRLVYRAMLALHEREADIDLFSVENEMRLLEPAQFKEIGGLNFIADDMLTIRSAAHIKTYAAHVIRCWVLRRLTALLKEHILAANVPDVDVMSLLSQIHTDVQKLEEFFAVSSTTHLVSEVSGQVLSAIYKEQQQRLAGENQQISTGIVEFDHYLGGLFRGEELVLAGRPSMGKTAIALHMAVSAAREGKRVCFFSLEMTERQLISRLLCTLSGVEPDKLRFQSLTAEERAKLDKAREELDRLPLHLDYCSGCTVEEIRAKCMVLNRKHPLAVIFVDYLNLVQVTNAGKGEVRDTMDLALGDVVRRIKGLVMELDMAGVVLAQLNRNCEARMDHTPVMSDLRNSGEIEQVADSIAFVYRPEQYQEYTDPTTRESLRGVGKLLVAKNRNGRTGEIRFRYNSSLTRIYPYKKEMQQ